MGTASDSAVRPAPVVPDRRPMNSSVMPRAMPIMGATRSQPSSAGIGARYLVCSCRSHPVQSPSPAVVTSSTRWDGTKASSTTMSLLPLPRNPDTNQVSTIWKSAFGTNAQLRSPMPGTPSITQSEKSHPLENSQRPERR